MSFFILALFFEYQQNLYIQDYYFKYLSSDRIYLLILHLFFEEIDQMMSFYEKLDWESLEHIYKFNMFSVIYTFFFRINL